MHRYFSLGTATLFAFSTAVSLLSNLAEAKVKLVNAGDSINITVNPSQNAHEQTIAICATNKSDVSLAFWDTANTPANSEYFYVLPGNQSVRNTLKQGYQVKMTAKGSSPVDPILVGGSDDVSFNSGCNSPQHNADLTFRFKNLDQLEYGYYSGQLIIDVTNNDQEDVIIPITINKQGGQVQITNLDDLVIVEGPDSWGDEHSGICVYTSTGSYNLEARSDNHGKLTGNGGNLDYSIWWTADGSETDITSQLVDNIGRLDDLQGDRKLNCATGVTAKVRVSASSTAVGNLLAGTYSDTITITVSP